MQAGPSGGWNQTGLRFARAQRKLKPSHLSSLPQLRPPPPAPPPMAESEHPPQVSSEPTTPPQEGSGRAKKKNKKNRSKKQPKRAAAAADTDGFSSGASTMVEDPFLVLAGGKEGGN